MGKRLNRKYPKIGNIYSKTYKKKEYKLEIVDYNGKIGFKVNNNIYLTPTGAAKSITNSDVNGWSFWKIN